MLCAAERLPFIHESLHNVHGRFCVNEFIAFLADMHEQHIVRIIKPCTKYGQLRSLIWSYVQMVVTTLLTTSVVAHFERSAGNVALLSNW